MFPCYAVSRILISLLSLHFNESWRMVLSAGNFKKFIYIFIFIFYLVLLLCLLYEHFVFVFGIRMNCRAILCYSSGNLQHLPSIIPWYPININLFLVVICIHWTHSIKWNIIWCHDVFMLVQHEVFHSIYPTITSQLIILFVYVYLPFNFNFLFIYFFGFRGMIFQSLVIFFLIHTSDG